MEDWFANMDGGFANALKQLIAASGGRITVGSGYRSEAHQAELYAGAVAKYGPDQAGWYVAPPGRSNHGKGVAADLGYMTEDAQQWAHDNAYRFGLNFPMDWEPWHIEPFGVRDGTYKFGSGETAVPDPEAYTTAPAGHTSPLDATKRMDLGYQLQSVNSMLLFSNSAGLTSDTPNELASPDTLAKSQTGGSIEEALPTRMA